MIALLLVAGSSWAGCFFIPRDGPAHHFWDPTLPPPCERNEAGECFACKSDLDCEMFTGEKGVCDRETSACATCSDRRWNGRETGVDCGGPDCPPCPGGHGCKEQEFYTPREDACCSTVCAQPCQACTKSRTGALDGRCAPVPLGADPFGACRSLGGCGVEGKGKCRCEDQVKNGDESDVDCGGEACKRCEGGKRCASATDCAPDVPACVHGSCCASACDGLCQTCNWRGACVLRYPGEWDARCPGDSACGWNGHCAGKPGAQCTARDQCLSGVCTGGVCARSAVGWACNTSEDCAHERCGGHVCQ